MQHHRARKRFGQHFLADSGVIDALVRAIGPQPHDAMVEIGPGLGALTFPLARQLATPLTVIELDRDLAARLRARPALEVVEADALSVDLTDLSQRLGRHIRLVGNLPYNVSTPILFHALEAAAVVQDQHFMLQKEVVERMVAGPGGRDYGRLSVMLQWRYGIESVLDVPPQAFEPAPKVDSAVVRMVPRAAGSLPVVDRLLLTELVAVAFSQRRKLLRNTLGRWLDSRAFDGRFDLQRRAEEVSVDEYVALACAVAALKRNAPAAPAAAPEL
jgi:16S rRNA (adenine1518-N6/adenine1519-N6)-dimethyltransferase